MGFSRFESLHSKHLLTLGRFSWVFVGFSIVGFRGLFVDASELPSIANMRKPTALESTEENIFLSQVCPHSQVHMQEDRDH